MIVYDMYLVPKGLHVPAVSVHGVIVDSQSWNLKEGEGKDWTELILRFRREDPRSDD